MANLGGCSVIIKDDFDNLLVIKRKGKKTEPRLWGLCSKKIKGKESIEKCATRAVKDDLSVIVFDLKEIAIMPFGENENHMLYVGSIKEKFVAHKDIEECKWVNINKINELEFGAFDKEMLSNYLNQ